MDVNELAEELYELIVVKGRWGGKPSRSITDGTWAGLPEWMKEMWVDEAFLFSKTHNLPLKDNSDG